MGEYGWPPLNEQNLAMVLDPVAEAIFERLFGIELGPDGIERAMYREAAEAGLRAGVNIFINFARGEQPSTRDENA